MSIRTTLTIDEDVWYRVQQESKATGESVRKTVNTMLRNALLGSELKGKRPKFEVVPFETGLGFRAGLNLDKTSQLLEDLEGPSHR